MLIHWLCGAVFLLVSACSTPDYARRDGPTNQFSDDAVRYGSIAGLGGAGYLAGRELGGNSTTGAVGATTGVLVGVGLNKFFDSKRRSAYRNGYDDGVDATRAEIVNEKWRREAVYGLKDQESSPPQPVYREVYVPSREIDGVKLQGEYQTVQIMP